MTFEKAKNALKVTNISNVLESEQRRNNVPFVFNPNGESYYIHEREEINESQFNRLYPLEKLIKTAYKGENSDRTKNWMQDQKSY